MLIMKKLLYIAMLGAALLTMSCTNLDEHIYSQIPKDDFLSVDANLVLYTTRPYTLLQKWGSEQSMWTLILQLSNEVAVPKSYSGAWGETRYSELQKMKIPAANKLVRKGWDFCFDGIAACNDALYEYGKVEQTNTIKKNIAEIKVLRAFYYFLAVDCFGNVPYSIDKTETDYPLQKDRAFMCQFLEKEIKDNMEFLDKTPSAANYGRVTEGMAKFLLAKIYLNSEVWFNTPKWGDVESICKDIMENGGYHLANTYEENFAIDNENGCEAIFAIPHSSVYTREAFYPYVLTLNSDLAGIWKVGSTWDGTFMGQPDFMASYEEGDLRKKACWLFGEIYDLDGNRVMYQEGITEDKKPIMKEMYLEDINIPEEKFSAGLGRTDGARIIKWPYQSDGTLTSYQVSMENDFYLMRYSDVVLMYVEALVRQKRTSEAATVAEFQKIRERAGLAPIEAGDLTLDNLLLERQHELCMEGWSREDLIRFGHYLDAWWSKDAGSAYQLLLPIPELAIGANPKLVQNNGY